MTKINLPKKVKIANHTIDIIDWPTTEAHSRNEHGLFSANELNIRIHTNQAKAHVIETLWHEIIHAIYWSYNICDDDKEERIVTTLAVGIHQMANDNPKIMKFLLS